jgi:hypothetical protein
MDPDEVIRPCIGDYFDAYSDRRVRPKPYRGEAKASVRELRRQNPRVAEWSADLQDPISLMGKMVAYWRNNTEIVACYRENRNDGSISRAVSTLAYAMA